MVQSNFNLYSRASQFPPGNSKKKAKTLNAEDRQWLISHKEHSAEKIDKLFKDFHTEYKNGGIFRK